MRKAVAVLFAISSATAGPLAAAEASLWLGANANGRDVFVDPQSLKKLPPAPDTRPFPVVQMFVVMQGPTAKDSTERVVYNFSCTTRTAATIHYYRTLKGQRTHDWRGADIKMKYYAIERGGLVEMALTYACSGGKLPPPVRPSAPSRAGTSGPDDDDG